jgi:hypothetical protein
VGIPIKAGHNNHTPGFTEHARTDEAHDATLKASVALAIVACRALAEPGFIEEVSGLAKLSLPVQARTTWEDTIRRIAEEM